MLKGYDNHSLLKLNVGLFIKRFVLLFGRMAKSPQGSGKRRETLKLENTAISEYIKLVFGCVIDKLLLYVKFRVE